MNFCHIVSLTFISYNNQQKKKTKKQNKTKQKKHQYCFEENQKAIIPGCPWVYFIFVLFCFLGIFFIYFLFQVLSEKSDIFLKIIQCDFEKHCLRFIILRLSWKEIYWFPLCLYSGVFNIWYYLALWVARKV